MVKLGPAIVGWTDVVEVDQREVRHFADKAEAWCLPRVKYFPEVIEGDDSDDVEP